MQHQTIEPAVASRLPFWPRLLSAELAAAYLGISKTNFLARVGMHELPAGTRLGGRLLWDLKSLDAFADALTGFDEEQEERGSKDCLFGV